MFPKIDKINSKGNVLRKRLENEGRKYIDLHLFDVNNIDKSVSVRKKDVNIGDIFKLDKDGKSIGMVVASTDIHGIYLLAGIQQLFLYLSNYYIVNPIILMNRNKFPTTAEVSMFIAAFRIACYNYRSKPNDKNKEAHCIIYNYKMKKKKK